MDPNNQLSIAFDRVSLVQLAHALGLVDVREGAAQKSPFREDRKAGSFSVQKAYFKDHAHDEHKGGHIAFVQLARPGWSKKECIEFIIREAGMEPEKQTAGAVKKVMRAKKQDMYRAAENKTAEIPKLNVPEPMAMSGEVRARWNDGQAAIIDSMAKLAESRGWDEAVMRKLIGLNKTSAPLLPWADEGERRMWAFMVEKPVFDGARAKLIPVGYHGRYKHHDKPNPPERRWVYVPYVPTKAGSDFQQYLVRMNTKLPAYPFVLGDLVNPRLVVILEGQFDAVSFALAFGWLESGLPAGVVVMGLRGVSSPLVMLSAYGGWLRRHNPAIWLIGDNDEAGRKLVKRKDPERIGGEPSFLDRLRAQGCRVLARYYDVEGCKDFNDIWKAHRPGVEQMRAMAAEAGCLEVVE